MSKVIGKIKVAEKIPYPKHIFSWKIKEDNSTEAEGQRVKT